MKLAIERYAKMAKAVKKRSGISYADLCVLLNLSAKELIMLLRSESMPSQNTINRLEELYNRQVN